MILGKITRDAGEVGDICEDGEVYRRTYYLLTSTITAAAQVIAEAHELDMNLEYITSRRIGHILKKMRFIKSRQGHTGKSGWTVSLADLVRWASSYGLESERITGLKFKPSGQNITNLTDFTNFTQPTATPFRGIL